MVIFVHVTKQAIIATGCHWIVSIWRQSICQPLLTPNF